MTAKSQKIHNVERFPIRVLAELTGVGTSTLRAWERRYGLIKPERTPKGHRLYSDADTRRVSKIIDLLNDGHSLPDIARLLAIKNSTGQYEITGETDRVSTMPGVWQDFINATLEATSDFSVERIDAIFNEASSLYPVDMVTDRLILPALTQLGEAWKSQPESGIAEEHFYTSWLKNRLGARFHHAYSQARGTRIVCACAPGTYHEIGLMLFAISALSRGYRVLYFGAGLPLDQLKHIIQRSAAKAVVLGIQTEIDPELDQQLANLIPQLKTPIFIGGPEALIDANAFETAGGTLLGSNISVALKVFERQLPPYSGTTTAS